MGAVAMFLALCLSAALASQVAEGEAGPWLDPFGLSASLDTSVGIGTFVASQKADDPYYASVLRITPSYAFDERITLSLDLEVGYEWTHLVTPCHAASSPRPSGGPAEDCSDTNDPNGRRGDLEDIRLTLAHDDLVSFFETTAYGSLGLRFPTSRASRAVSNLVTLAADAGLSRGFGPLTPSLDLSFRKFFPSERSPLLSPDEGDGAIPAGHCPLGQTGECLLLAGFAPSWRFGAGIALAFEIPGVDGLSSTLSLGYNYTRRFGTGGDGLSSARTDAEGRKIVDGTNELDTTSGGLEIAYAISEAFGAAFGFASEQPAFTEDGQALRFPFFDFISPANNYTSWYLTLSYTLR